MSNGKTSYLANVQHCGRSACPVCGSKISHQRGIEISEGIVEHLRRGGGVATGLLTVPHSVGDELKPMLDLLLNGWRRILADREFRQLREELRVVGYVRGFEVTVGRNSWHPHIHHLLLTERPLSPHDLKRLQRAIFRVWREYCGREGYRVPLSTFNRCERVRTPQAVARYVTKVTSGHELTSPDTKNSKGRSPLQILDDFTRTGDDDDLQLWLEYEDAVYRRSLLRWSRGLKDALGVDEVTDQEIVDREEGGVEQLQIEFDDYKILSASPDGIPTVLHLVEKGRVDEARDFIQERCRGSGLMSYTTGYA